MDNPHCQTVYLCSATVEPMNVITIYVKLNGFI